MRVILCSLLVLCTFITTLAQKPDQTLSIRNAFEDPTETASPAKVSFTIPDTGKTSYLINLGIAYSIIWAKKDTFANLKLQQLSPFIVFNRNTMIDKEQYNYKGGGAYEYQMGHLDTNYINVNDITSTVQYLNNVIDTAQSFILTSYWTLFHANRKGPKGSVFVNAYKKIAGSSLFYELTPNCGLELQDIYKATKDSSGLQARVYLKPSASIAWRHPTKLMRSRNVVNSYEWPKKLELSVSYIMRMCFVNNVKGFDNYIPLFTPSVTYYPTSTQDFSVSLSYSMGADPVAGLSKQNFLQFALQFQL